MWFILQIHRVHLNYRELIWYAQQASTLPHSVTMNCTFVLAQSLTALEQFRQPDFIHKASLNLCHGFQELPNGFTRCDRLPQPILSSPRLPDKSTMFGTLTFYQRGHFVSISASLNKVDSFVSVDIQSADTNELIVVKHSAGNALTHSQYFVYHNTMVGAPHFSLGSLFHIYIYNHLGARLPGWPSNLLGNISYSI